MKRSERLAKIIALTSNVEGQAGKSLAQALARYQRHKAQLERLQGYRRDYQQDLSACLKQRSTARELRDFRAFLDSLDRAIEQQGALVEKCQRQVDEARGQWLARKREVQKMEGLMERQRRHEQQTAALLESKENDDRYQHGFQRIH